MVGRTPWNPAHSSPMHPAPITPTHLPLPLSNIHQHNALRELLIRDQDLVQLIVNRLSGHL